MEFQVPSACFRFSCIDLSGIGPFANCQVLSFGTARCVSLASGHGLGKTTLSNALRMGFEKEGPSSLRGIPAAALADLVFVDDFVSFGRPDRGSHSLMELVSKLELTELEVASLEELSSQGLRDAFPGLSDRRWIGAPLPSRFGLCVCEDGSIEVVPKNSNGEPFVEYYSMGKSTCLTLAVLVGLRRLLCLDLPIVVDDVFHGLDRELSTGCFSLLANATSQLIMLQSDTVFEGLGIVPNYRLVADNQTHTTMIVDGGEW